MVIAKLRGLHPARVHIRAKNTELWEAIKPFVAYLMKKTPFKRKEETNVGLYLEMDADDADFLHLALCHHRLPITVEIDVLAYQ